MIQVKQQCMETNNLPPQYMTLPSFDTIRPTLIHYGKGLMYYECILLKHQSKIYSSKNPEKEKSIVMKASYTELELDILKQNLLFIDKQCQIQIQEWIRKDKMDLNLGEAIKGFYMKPIF